MSGSVGGGGTGRVRVESMDSFELTKVLGALLAAGLIATFAGFIAGQVYPEPEMETRAYVPESSEETEAAGAQEAAAPTEPEATGIVAVIAAATPEAGQKVFKKCAACHTPNKGGANRIGPNLWDVVNRPVASAEGFAYSDALKGRSGEVWSFESLDAFLQKPKDWAPGNKMSFAGVKKPEQRAQVIAYLRSLSDSPAALPE